MHASLVALTRAPQCWASCSIMWPAAPALQHHTQPRARPHPSSTSTVSPAASRCW